MPSDSIVETLNVIKHIRLGVLPGGVDQAFDSLFLQSAEERFGNRIVPTVPSTAHAGQQIVVPAPTIKFTQYTSVTFGKRCKEMGVRPSIGPVGDAYDSAMAETFFATLECELIDRRIWKTHSEARLAIFTRIDTTPRHKRCSGLTC